MTESGDIMGYHAKLAATYKVAYTFMMSLGIYQLRLSHPDSAKTVLTSGRSIYEIIRSWHRSETLVADSHELLIQSCQSPYILLASGV